MMAMFTFLYISVIVFKATPNVNTIWTQIENLDVDERKLILEKLQEMLRL